MALKAVRQALILKRASVCIPGLGHNWTNTTGDLGLWLSR